MNKALFGLLNCAAVTSSAVANYGKTHLVHQITQNNASWWGWGAMGIGNDTATVGSANNSGIMGNESFYVAVNGSYEADYTAVYKHTFNYSDLTSHTFGEAVITKNVTEFDSDTLLARIVYDDITLNLSDTLSIEMKVAF